MPISNNIIDEENAPGESRTPMSLPTQRSERCLYTNFSTGACTYIFTLLVFINQLATSKNRSASDVPTIVLTPWILFDI